MAPQDIKYADGKLSITVHNIGNLDCGPFKVNVSTGTGDWAKLEGAELKTFEIPGLEALNDLEPRTHTFELDWTIPPNASLELPSGVTVKLDPDDKYYEITEVNNVITRQFPHEEPPYMTPRAWPSLVQENPGLKKYQPFPADFPKERIR